MIMSSYFNVQYLHQKMIRIYADIVQNHTLPGVFPNFWRAVYVFKQILIWVFNILYELIASHILRMYICNNNILSYKKTYDNSTCD